MPSVGLLRGLAVAGVLTALLTASCTATHQATAGNAGTAHERESTASSEGQETDAEHGRKFRAETPDNALYARLKAQANTRPPQVVARTATSSTAPVVRLNKIGAHDSGAWHPTDANGARSADRYIEVINNTVAVYDSSLTFLKKWSTFALGGTTSGYVGDPEIIYDPGAKKFFYTLMDQDSTGSWRLDYGFSKTASPTTAADFCHYSMPATGSRLTDYPRLGATKDFLLIGVNNFTGGATYAGSSVFWATKPSGAPVTTCPAAQRKGEQTGFPFTPVPSHQTDPDATGYVLASTWSGGSALTEYTVTRSATGTPVFSPAQSVPVPSYRVPADASQPGTSDKLATGDARLFQVIQSWDNGAPVLWTSHTISGGAGAAARWYELGTDGAVLQSGTIEDARYFYYYPTISPDRVFHSAISSAHGDNMVIGFNRSSSTTPVGIAVASERGRNGISPVVVAVGGDGTHISCGDNGSVCRWGDRSSATSQLSAPATGATGIVWLSHSVVANGDYYTRNLEVSP